jgi:acyl-CoA thioesterase
MAERMAEPTSELYLLTASLGAGELVDVDPSFMASLPDDTLLADLGIVLRPVGRGASRVEMTVGRGHLNQRGIAQAGAIVALADAAAGWASYSAIEDGKFTTLNLEVNLLRPGRDGDELVAEARPVHLGRRTHVLAVTVTRSDVSDKPLARFTCTQMVLSGQETPPQGPTP